MWKRYEKEIDVGANFMIMIPESAYVERVYDRITYAGFSDFGMPFDASDLGLTTLEP